MRASSHADRLPRVWLLLAHKTGDNAQIQALAEALGWPFENKRLFYRKTELITNLLLGQTLAGVDKHKSASLKPPWPDLVISAGRRNEPVCRWIRKKTNKRVRIVHLGRPWARLQYFDLIVTTPQYHVPKNPNVLEVASTLHRATDARLDQDSARWISRFSHLPRPYIAVLIGGNSGRYTFDTEAAERLGLEADRLATAKRGSLLVTSSARTKRVSMEAFASAISCPNFLYEWTSESDDNPYFAYLALADCFIVTAESVSMLTEACAMGKQVYMFDFGTGADSMRADRNHNRDESTAQNKTWWQRLCDTRYQVLLHKLAMRYGPQRMRRDIRVMHKYFIASGRAVWLNEKFPSASKPPLSNDMACVVARVRRLFQ